MAHYEGSAPSRIFYGWWIAVAFSLITFLSSGIRFAVGPFLKPVVRDLDLDRGTFSLVISLSLFLYGAFMPLVGPLVDRWGARVVCSLGAVVMAGSLVLTGTMTSLWQFALYYGVLGALGLAATGQVVGLTTLTRWFVKRCATDAVLLADGRRSLLLRLLDEPTLGPRGAHADRPRLPRDDGFLGDRIPRHDEHRRRHAARHSRRPLRPQAPARVGLSHSCGGVQPALLRPRADGAHGGGRVRRNRHGGQPRPHLGALRRHLRPLLGRLDLQPHLS